MVRYAAPSPWIVDVSFPRESQSEPHNPHKAAKSEDPDLRPKTPRLYDLRLLTGIIQQIEYTCCSLTIIIAKWLQYVASECLSSSNSVLLLKTMTSINEHQRRCSSISNSFDSSKLLPFADLCAEVFPFVAKTLQISCSPPPSM